METLQFYVLYKKCGLSVFVFVLFSAFSLKRVSVFKSNRENRLFVLNLKLEPLLVAQRVKLSLAMLASHFRALVQVPNFSISDPVSW